MESVTLTLIWLFSSIFNNESHGSQNYFVPLGPPPAHISGILLQSIETVSLSHLQIVSMQTLHYLTLSVFIPPLLNIFAEPSSLHYEGGAANVGKQS